MKTELEAPHDPGVAARAALLEQVGSDVVGDYLGAEREGDGVTTHRFASTQAGYPGWQWTVTVAQVDEALPTVDEIVLIPGDEAIVAPAWVPWRERIRPGDLSAGDILPTDEDDPRLVPGYFAGDPEDEGAAPLDKAEARALIDEVGLGRSRVLSVEGRDQAVQRWYDGDAGPAVPLAQSAPGRCGNCGFLVRLAGPMSTMFGVCANAFANDDGRAVSLDHGCGAHSEAQLRKKQLPPPLPDPVFDSISRDDLEEF
ncbi:DUF3027 domain-containing protein [Nocardioides terrisoli]|uniref:DUF3027 domain-containing protein n=1 Tax=Nocardioides terrisoli TaxID=3388267 RepID=UPI00287B6BBD|nr:DUF3027 domain-containing protein [Nocardioides marmorisolisilvae]